MQKMFVAAFCVLMALGGASRANDYKAGSIVIGHPWSRPTPPSAPVASGYMTLSNSGRSTDRLVEVISPIAGKAEIHQSVVESGVAKMRPLADGVMLAPFKTVDFAAERMHIMFMQPQRQLNDGDKFPVTLVFEKSGRVEVEFMVQRSANESSGEHAAHGTPQ